MKVANEKGSTMTRILLGIACALLLTSFTAPAARADEKPADAAATPAKKTHHKKKKAAEGDKGAATGSTTTTK